jgi:surfeit locus 1 family protein
MMRRALPVLLFGLAGVAVLVALGVWQVQRLAWKTALIAGVEARLAAAPVPVPPHPDPLADQYRRVRASGVIEPGELHVYTPAPGGGAGYRVIVPLKLPDGRRILLDRGFVPVEAKDAPRRLGPIAVEGSLRWPQESDRFTSPPDRAGNVWFARDVGPMAEALGTEPVLLVAARTDDPAGPLPLPVGVNIRNDHLGYAITWFGLAAVWAGMTGYGLWRIKRRPD